MKRFRIDCELRRTAASTPLSSLRVEVWDCDVLVDDFIGSAITDDASVLRALVKIRT